MIVKKDMLVEVIFYDGESKLITVKRPKNVKEAFRIVFQLCERPIKDIKVIS